MEITKLEPVPDVDITLGKEHTFRITYVAPAGGNAHLTVERPTSLSVEVVPSGAKLVPLAPSVVETSTTVQLKISGEMTEAQTEVEIKIGTLPWGTSGFATVVKPQ